MKMKWIKLFLLTSIFSVNAFAGGAAPSKIDCDRDTYRHFLEQGNYVLSIEDPNDFNRHWEGFVNRANTEWRDSLLACGYDPQDLRDHLTTVRARLIMEECAECRKDASDRAERDTDRCRADRNKEGQSFKECLDRADANFREHLRSCNYREIGATLKEIGPKSVGVNVRIGGGGKCDGGACSK
jgi:hypothetical protein